jgi:hypothetical protein
MLTILIRPRLLRPAYRVVILILVIVAICRVAPGLDVPVGLGSCLGWLTAARREPATAACPTYSGSSPPGAA